MMGMLMLMLMMMMMMIVEPMICPSPSIDFRCIHHAVARETSLGMVK